VELKLHAFFITALEGGCKWSDSCFGQLCLMFRWVCRPQRWSGRGWEVKISALTGNWTAVIQPRRRCKDNINLYSLNSVAKESKTLDEASRYVSGSNKE